MPQMTIACDTEVQMKYVSIPGIDKPLPRIICGTAQLRDTATHHRFLDLLLAMGCTAFDSARIYPESEQSLGTWLKERHVHSQVTVITKCGHPAERGRMGLDDLLSDADRSRRALGIDMLDLLLLHRDDESVPVQAIVDRMNILILRGRTRAYGVSNWRARRIALAQDYARQSGQVLPSISSPQFSLASWVREPWAGCISMSGLCAASIEERNWYRASSFPVIAWSCLAAGFALGSGSEPPPHAGHASSCYEDSGNRERMSRARQLAEQKNVGTAQIALAYVLSESVSTLAVTATTKSAHFRANIAALRVPLSDDERQWLNLEKDDLRP